MAITNFIPTVWSAILLRELRKSLVFAACVNRNYEGEIKGKGDTVKITGLTPPTIKDYSRATALDAPEFVADDTRSLEIDQEKYFNAGFDDLDLLQAQGGKNLLSYCRDQAAFAFKDKIDNFLAARHADADAGNVIDVVQITKANVYEYLEALSVKLSDNDVPTENRWVVLPPWICSLVRQSDYFTHATELGDKVVTNGFVGMAAGFKVHESNNLVTQTISTVKHWKVMAGHTMAITFAEQVTKMEAYRHPDFFSDNLKGLIAYGAKTVFPKALAVLQAKQTA